MTENRVFNWAPHHDERSKSFPIRTATAGLNTRRRNKQWKVGPILDQGQEGACVGFGWAAEALSTPVAVKLDKTGLLIPRDPNKFARYLYNEAKTLDDEPGENYEGTSVLAGAKAMQASGFLKEYRWAFSINDVADAVLGRGPVVLGTYWRDSMYEPVGGVLSPSGDIVGGHCYLAVGYRKAADELGGKDGFVIQNSWGSSWGKNGLALISVGDLDSLLKDDGEACVPYTRSYGLYKA